MTTAVLNIELEYKSNYKYLGHIIANDHSDELDMKAKQRSLYGRSNMLTKQFYACSASVKLKLFSTYCSKTFLYVLQ